MQPGRSQGIGRWARIQGASEELTSDQRFPYNQCPSPIDRSIYLSSIDRPSDRQKERKEHSIKHTRSPAPQTLCERFPSDITAQPRAPSDFGAMRWVRVTCGPSATGASLCSRPLLTPSRLLSTGRAGAPLLFGDKEWDGTRPSKCPFTGGSNGGGLGDFNILTLSVFVLSVVLIRLCLRRALPPLLAWALRPKRKLLVLSASAAAALPAVAWLAARARSGGGDDDMPTPGVSGIVGENALDFDDRGRPLEVEAAPSAPAPAVHEATEDERVVDGSVEAGGARWSRAELERRSQVELSKVRACADDPANPAAALRAAGEGDRLLDEAELACCWLLHEGPSEALPLPRFRVTARPSKILEPELRQMALVLGAALERREPFTIMWDLRKLRPPTLSALNYGAKWQGENADAIESLGRSIAVLVSSPVTRVCANLCVRVCNPPQPVLICTDEAEATQWARAQHEVAAAAQQQDEAVATSRVVAT